MIVVLALLSVWQPLLFQKTHAGESLIESMATSVVTAEDVHFFEDATCAFVDTFEMLVRLPYQILPAQKTVSMQCSFETACGETGHRHIFHREFYGAFKPAESFAWTIAETCPAMLNASGQALTRQMHMDGGEDSR